MKLTEIINLLVFQLILVAADNRFNRGPEPEVLELLKSDNNELFARESGPDLYSYEPATSAPVAGIIYCPGGFINYESYAPYAKSLASKGYKVFVPKVALNIAVLSAGVFDKIMTKHPDIDNWIVAGHSVGGTAAAKFGFNKPAKVKGIIILSSYPKDDFKSLDTPMQIIVGDRDVRFNSVIRETKAKTNAELVVIKGGNHGQMGYYGPNGGGDLDATITRDQQQAEVVAAMNRFIREKCL